MWETNGKTGGEMLNKWRQHQSVHKSIVRVLLRKLCNDRIVALSYRASAHADTRLKKIIRLQKEKPRSNL
jgi:hypothetical protein